MFFFFFYCIFNHINAALVSIRNFQNIKKSYQLTCTVLGEKLYQVITVIELLFPLNGKERDYF